MTTPATTPADLLPCPFCGEQPDSSDVGLYVVECPACGIVGPSCEGTNGSAIDAWNNRATPRASSSRAEVEQAVPEGWKLVPVKATAEMKAACRVAGKVHVWDDMIAAAPTPPAAATEAQAVPELFRVLQMARTAMIDNGLTPHGLPRVFEVIDAALAAAEAPTEDAHPDDIAVDMFAKAMKEKLAQARTKGRSGWQTCSKYELSNMLREHVEKGDPRDVANFCMFLHALGHGIQAAPPADRQGVAPGKPCYCCGSRSCNGECFGDDMMGDS